MTQESRSGVTGVLIFLGLILAVLCFLAGRATTISQLNDITIRHKIELPVIRKAGYPPGSSAGPGLVIKLIQVKE